MLKFIDLTDHITIKIETIFWLTYEKVFTLIKACLPPL